MKSTLLAGLALLFAALPAAAQTTTQRSEQNVEPWAPSNLRDEQFGFRPQVGYMNFTDAKGGTSTRIALGVNADMNALKNDTTEAGSARTCTHLWPFVREPISRRWKQNYLRL